MKTLVLAILSAAIAVLPGNPVHAAARPQATLTKSVSYADLDMTSARGRERLKDRIAFTAYRVCLVDAPASPSPSIADPVCFRSAMKDALAQMERMVARANSNRLLATSAAAPSGASR
ncbi:MAG: UrcA family protein [Sphingomicrobium sp.]